MHNTLHLFIPGLLGPFSSTLREWQAACPPAPALSWLLGRAQSVSARRDVESALLAQCGLDLTTVPEPPVAALTRLADDPEASTTETGWWLRADPVHLRADVNTVLLADARVLHVTPEEAQALVATLNTTFAGDGLHYTAPHPARWYLRLENDPGLQTHPLSAVIGRDVRHFLPTGVHKARWHTLLTETQMLLYQHPVNRAREARGLPVINSLWWWGGGQLPTQQGVPHLSYAADDPLIHGWERLQHATASPAPDRAEDWSMPAQEDSLIVLEHTRHDPAEDMPEQWAAHVQAVERTWAVPCRHWLQTGQLAALHLWLGNGQHYTVRRADRWKVWRRPIPLAQYLCTDDA